MPHIKSESQALSKEKFGGNDVFRSRLWKLGCEVFESGVAVLCFRCEENSGGYEFFGMISHGGVG